MDRSASTLSQGTRSNLGNGQQPVRGFCVKGLYFGAYRTNSVRGVAVDLAIKGVNLVASNATRLDHQTNLNAQDKPVRVVVLAATQLSSVAAGIEEGSTEWVMRVTRLAAWQVDDAVKMEKPVAETAVQQINEQVKKMQNIFCHRWSRPVGGLFSNLCGDFIGCAKDENRPLLGWCASRAAPHLLCGLWPSAFVFLLSQAGQAGLTAGAVGVRFDIERRDRVAKPLSWCRRPEPGTRATAASGAPSCSVSQPTARKPSKSPRGGGSVAR
jgi:hypothetical protein